MMVLWQKSPLTAQDIIERVPQERNWPATTVKTLLARLVERDTISAEEIAEIEALLKDLEG